MLISDEAINHAVQVIAPRVLRTPMVPSYALSQALGTRVFLKCELFQPTGSFKVRGVFTKAAMLTNDERDRGLIAFSAGNHAMAVAHVGVGLGLPVTVCMPAGAVQFKIDAHGVKIVDAAPDPDPDPVLQQIDQRACRVI